jgi:hypothetical protein
MMVDTVALNVFGNGVSVRHWGKKGRFIRIKLQNIACQEKINRNLGAHLLLAGTRSHPEADFLPRTSKGRRIAAQRPMWLSCTCRCPSKSTQNACLDPEVKEQVAFMIRMATQSQRIQIICSTSKEYARAKGTGRMGRRANPVSTNSERECKPSSSSYQQSSWDKWIL